MTDVMHKLVKGAAAFGLELSARQVDQFAAYWTLLSARNQVMNLSAIHDHAEAVEKHFLDSLALAKTVNLAGKCMIDIGSGAGFPGLPLKIAVPSLELTLLDSLGKRVDFLSEVCTALGLAGVRCVHARAEEWAATAGQRETYDYATGRAVSNLNMLSELALPYVRVGGAFLAMKMAHNTEEAESAADAIAHLGGKTETHYDYSLPSAPAQVRRVLLIRKQTPTPLCYPRRFAKMQKSPL